MKNKWTMGAITVVIIIGLSIFLLGFNNNKNKIPMEVYQVYLNGDVIGTIKSKKIFENIINSNQEELKEKYDVDTIYTPRGVSIKKIITYNNKVDKEIDVYNKLKELEPFTIKGFAVTITNAEKEQKKINVLSKEIFDDALIKTIKAFVGEEKYEKYMTNTQDEITKEGSIVENIDKEETITYREDLLSTNEEIFTDIDILARYLMYGTTDLQTTYKVQSGETIEDVANANKLNVHEFLIANHNFTSANNLLYEDQEVIVELIDPIITIVVEEYSVSVQEKSYATEIQYDPNQSMGYEEEVRPGENGSDEVASKLLYINGQLLQSVTTKTTELKPSISRIIVKGEKVVPDVADLSYWAWPTKTPYMVTSGWGYRWGEFHPAIDITGPGYGSDIFAINNGRVYKVGYNHPTKGIYVVINHNQKNLYSLYQHLASANVVEGQTVSRGQRIGTMGNSGWTVPAATASNPYAGTHLHFEVYIGPPGNGGYEINPWTLYQ